MKCLELRLPNLLPSQFVSNLQNLACVVIHHVLVFWLAMSSYFGSRSTYARRLYDCCLFLRFLFFFFFWSHHVCPHYIIDRVNCQERHRDRQSATPRNVFTYRSTQFAPTQTQSFRPTAQTQRCVFAMSSPSDQVRRRKASLFILRKELQFLEEDTARR